MTDIKSSLQEKEVKMEEDYFIIRDTREQKPLEFKGIDVLREKLDVGDYACRYKNTQLPVVFERKSALDLFGTLGSGHARFKKEIQRALDNFQILYIIVECPYSSIKNKTFENSFRSRMKGYVITKICHTLEAKYDVRFVFTNSRNESSAYIRGTFEAWIRESKYSSI